MIASFRDRATRALFEDILVPRFRAIASPARRKLLYLHRARALQDLKVPPGNALARDLAVPPNRISEIVNGKRTISADTALRLGRYFGVSPELWLALQSDYDLRVARRTVGKGIERQVRTRVA